MTSAHLKTYLIKKLSLKKKKLFLELNIGFFLLVNLDKINGILFIFIGNIMFYLTLSLQKKNNYNNIII